MDSNVWPQRENDANRQRRRALGVYVTRLPDREEFRRHCDNHKTSSAILATLG